MTDSQPQNVQYYKHAECDKAFAENRFEDACDACRGIDGSDAGVGSVE